MLKSGLLLSFLFLIQCPWAVKEKILEPHMLIPVEDRLELLINGCNSNLSYVPDTNSLTIDPVKYIRINFHFMNDSKMEGNYSGEVGIEYARNLVYHANRKLQFNKKMSLPIGNETPAIYPRYQYVLTPSSRSTDDSGIYFHADDDLCYFVNEGERNNYKRDVINKYRIGEDSILNVFYMVHHPDSVRSKTYSASSSGIALGKSIKLGTKFNPSDDPWRHASLLNHEIGHVMGLSHTWNLNDGCDDTPKNPNCWSKTQRPPCNKAVSNNMMDYNSNQHAITPCQIGKIRKNMAKLDSRQRDLLQERWCMRDENMNVMIEDKEHFNSAKDIEGDIHIMPGASLKISCRLSMPENSEIIVNPGATLILDGAWLHNSCGKEWKGVRVLEKGRLKGLVYGHNNPRIEDTEVGFEMDQAK